MDTFEILKQLTEEPGPSGREDRIRASIESLWQPYVDSMHTDALGNLISNQPGTGTAPRPTIMLAAHMDEIGMLVNGFEDGFVRVTSLGGTDRRVLLGTEVEIAGREPVRGIIGSRPPHVLPVNERQTILPWHELFIDCGLPEDKLKSLVRTGDHVTVVTKTVKLKNDQVAGKALDNRSAVTVLTLALKALAERTHAWDVIAVATVQEEVGLYGAITSAQSITPTLALAVDGTFGTQYNDKGSGAFELGKGPTIGVGPNFHPDIVKRLIESADNEEIPYQLEALPGSSGTDAWGIQVACEGIPSGLLSIPLRYMHQPVEVANLKDLERTARLISSFVASLPEDYRPTWEDEA